MTDQHTDLTDEIFTGAARGRGYAESIHDTTPSTDYADTETRQTPQTDQVEDDARDHAAQSAPLEEEQGADLAADSEGEWDPWTRSQHRHAGSEDDATAHGPTDRAVTGAHWASGDGWHHPGQDLPTRGSQEQSVAAHTPQDVAPANSTGSSTAVAAPGGEPLTGRVLAPAGAGAQGKATGLAALLQALGFGRKQRDAAHAEQAAAFERTIRQTTWTRAVNIVVGGGTGTAPAALTVGGLAAQVRGGSCVAFEATASRGHLLDLCEGNPARGLAELIDNADRVGSAGNLAGYTIPQTSHLAVIGSVRGRAQLTGTQLARVRSVLDTYHQISVAALDDALDCPVATAAISAADAVVIPAVMTKRSLWQAARAVENIRATKPALAGKVVIALGHSGAPENSDTTATAAADLQRVVGDVATVITTPFEPAFIADEDLVLDRLLPASRLAWLEVTSTVIATITDD